MVQRLAKARVYQLIPGVRDALAGLGRIAEECGIEKPLLELVKLRASQINGCAYCLHMHAADARKGGERQERLDVLARWREAGCFSAREGAALAWTEAVTMISEGQVPDEAYEEVAAELSEAEIAGLTAAVIAINGWNRVATAFRFRPSIGNA